MSFVNIPWWLIHVYFLLRNTMKKSILYIKLPKSPPFWNSYRENKSNCGCLDYWTKCIFITNSLLLFKTFGYQTWFIAIYGTIGLSFNLIHPLTTDYILTFGFWNQMPCLVSEKCNMFIVHSLNPILVCKRLRYTCLVHLQEQLPNCPNIWCHQ